MTFFLIVEEKSNFHKSYKNIKIIPTITNAAELNNSFPPNRETHAPVLLLYLCPTLPHCIPILSAYFSSLSTFAMRITMQE